MQNCIHHQPGTRHAPAVFESLESRRHLSGTPKFQLLEADFAGPGIANYTRVWWTGAADLTSSHGVFDPSQARIALLANIAQNGGKTPWQQSPISPNTLTFLDFEVDQRRDPTYYKKRLTWFRQAAPKSKVAIIGIDFGLSGMIREWVANPTAAQLAKINAQLQAQAPMINSMNVIPIEVYMLGPKVVDRDLKFIQSYAAILRKAFPTKPIYAWAWGAYHTSWNPVNSVMSDSVTQRYIQTIMSSTDGMVIWGPHADNDKLEKMAVKMAAQWTPPAPAPPVSTLSSLFSNRGVLQGPPAPGYNPVLV